MGRAETNVGFCCVECGTPVRPLTNGSYRNHCPFCLTSVHVDDVPGDRASTCRGVMDAVDIERSRKGWQIVHRCRRCGAIKRNRVAENTDQSDDVDLMIRLMRVQP